MFDYITVIFIVVLALTALIGFWRGAFKTLSWIILVAASIILAIFLSKWLAQVYRDGPIGGAIYNGFYPFLAGKINIEVAPGYTITGDTMTTADKIALYNTMGQTATGDATWTLFHAAYENVKLPPVFYNLVDRLLNESIAAYNGAEFALAAPIANVITNAVCFAAAFGTIFGAAMFVGGIVLSVLRFILKLAKGHPGLFSRLLGLIGGFAIGCALVWATCLTFNLIMLMDNDAATYLRGILHMTEGDTTWTFAKWLTSTDFGYSGVISFFIG